MTDVSVDQLVLTLELDDADLDPDDLERSVRRVREALFELEVEAVAPVPAVGVPDGSKSGGAFALGGLLVTLMQTPELLSSIVSVVAGWLGDRGGRSVKLTIDGDTLELTGASRDERRMVVESWLARHGRDPE